jgi:hypothetical protein
MIMFKNATKRFIVYLTGLGLLFSTLVGGVNAAMVGTDAAINAEQRATHIAELTDWLSRDRVRIQLANLGVDPTDAAERVRTMTSEELRALDGKVQDLPAGAGVLEVIGIVFVVLLILDLVGVTHVFSHI